MANRRRSVEWHKDWLKNYRVWIKDTREEIWPMIEVLKKCEQECDYRQAQIAQAEAEGLREFDPDTYRLKEEAN